MLRTLRRLAVVTVGSVVGLLASSTLRPLEAHDITHFALSYDCFQPADDCVVLSGSPPCPDRLQVASFSWVQSQSAAQLCAQAERWQVYFD